MSFSIGIVGLPNVGKSTLFNAITKQSAEVANYPFCTIDPNVGVVEVPDERLLKLAEIFKSAKIVPTIIEFNDIAGLIKDAHKGEGLGNQFLSHIREVDAIAEVVRFFEDKDIEHVDKTLNPVKDIDTINIELIMADLELVGKRFRLIEREAKSGEKGLILKKNALEKLKNTLEDEKMASALVLTEEEKEAIKDIQLLTTKPIIYIANVSEEDYKNPDVKKNISDKLKGIVDPGFIVPISAKIEAELAELDENERKDFLKELRVPEGGLDKLITASYKILNLITFFAAGEKEAHAWTIKKGAKAPEAAGEIHSDFQARFIRADVISADDLIKYEGYTKAREKGLVRSEGKDYVMQDGDVVIFKI